MTHFTWPVRVYYEDTDAGGVVYYANYLKFMERARTEWLRALGVEQDRLRQEEGLLLMVHSLSVRYKKPAKFNEALLVSVHVQYLGKAKITFMQQILRQDEVLCESEVTIACVDEATGRPSAFGQQLQHAFKGVLG
jgi:acyl-CoA thioester hydrolase